MSVERRLFLAVLLVAAVLAAPLPGHNENRTLALLRAMTRGRLTIDDDAQTSDRAWRDGHFYSGGAPGLAFALLPVYAAARLVLPERAPFPAPALRGEGGGEGLELVLVLAGAALPLAAAAVAARRALLALLACKEEEATRAAVAFALGTLALPFGTRLYANALVLALLAWSLFLLMGESWKPASGGFSDAKRRAHVALGGFLAASAVVCDYQAALPAAALALLVFFQGKRVFLAFLGGCVLPAVALGAYHQACFGSPLRTAYDFHADADMRSVLAAGGWGFTWPRPSVVLELFLGTRRGFLWTQPAALVGLAGLVALVRERSPLRRTLAVALGVSVLVILANAARARDWDAGASFGARYTTQALPFLALGLPRGLALLGRGARPLLAASIALGLAGATGEWGFSVHSTFESIAVLGPRARGLAFVVLGAAPRFPDPGTVIPVAVLSAAALSAALAGARLLLQKSKERRLELAAIAVLPWLACAPAVSLSFLRGPGGVAGAFRELERSEARRQIRGTDDVFEARRILGVMRGRARREQLDDPELVVLALDRVIELDPKDDEARAERARLGRR